MFETSVVRDRVLARRRYGLLTASVVAHTLVVAGVVTASLSSVSFPRRAPNEMMTFNPIPAVSIPPPLGSRSSPQHPAVQPVPRQQSSPAVVTAPAVIPTVTVPAGGSAGDVLHGAGASGEDGRDGVPDGEPGGIDLGQPAVSQPSAMQEVPYVPGGEVKAAVVLQRVEPEFPRAALSARMGGTVVLRCVIGKTGEIRDAVVVSSTFAPFERPALDALRQWKFAPGSMHGRPVDTWFELTVRFAPR